MADKLKYIFSQLSIALLLAVLLMFTSAHASQLTLAWDQPETNEDGSALTDLAGYIVYYGTSANNYDHGYDVGNVTTYTFIDLDIGQKYYFAVTAYDSAGNESQYSVETSATVPEPANLLPDIYSFEASTTSGSSPLPVTFTVGASDSDGAITTYEWDVDGDGTYDTATDINTLTYSYISSGSYNVTVRITDNSGDSVITEPLLITVVGNQRPVISSVSKKRSSKLRYTFSTMAEDPDGQITTYKWDLNGDGRFEKTTKSNRVSHKYKYKGRYKIKVKAIDNEGRATTVIYKTRIY